MNAREARMRKTVRTVATVVFCVVIIASNAGCRTGRESNAAVVSQTPAGETAPPVWQSLDEGTTLAEGFDPTRPVREPNEFGSPSRPAIIHWPRENILPLSPQQVEDIKSIVQRETRRDTWFIFVLDNAEDLHPLRRHCLEAYAVPDCQSARIRRGSGVYIWEGLLGPDIRPFSYAYVCETAEAFPADLAPPGDLTRFPFKVRGDISDEEIIEVVQFIRLGPSVPKWIPCTPLSDIRRFFIPDRVEDPAASIQVVSRKGEVIEAEMTEVRSDVVMIYDCQRIDGVWTLVNTRSTGPLIQ